MVVSGESSLGILQKGHKTEVHVHLIMTMEQRGAWIGGNQFYVRLGPRAHHHHILLNPASF